MNRSENGGGNNSMRDSDIFVYEKINLGWFSSDFTNKKMSDMDTKRTNAPETVEKTPEVTDSPNTKIHYNKYSRCVLSPFPITELP